MPILIDLTGRRFGWLEVLRRDGVMYNISPAWLCRCDCGAEKRIAGEHLRKGAIRSCGCKRDGLVAAKLRRHGAAGRGAKKAEWVVWTGMRKRCENPRTKGFPNYGGRGIRVCERWQSFANFHADMGDRPSSKHQIDRINNDGNYEPGNCRWATATEQANNRRKRRTRAAA